MESRKTLKEQANVMADKLKEAAKRLPDEKLIIEYDNGGGQKGTRENPFFPAYEKLLAAYTKTVAALEQLGEGAPEVETNLDSIRARFKVG